MTNHEICRHLRELAQLDYDAVRAYRQAVEQVDLADIRDQLALFENDHSQHIQNLSQIIILLGGNAPEMKPDIDGVLLEGLTAMRSVTGTRGALGVMESSEKLTNKRYFEATQLHLPADIKAQIALNFRDEQRHLQYVQQKVAEKVWQMR